MNLTVKADVSELSRVTDFVDEALTDCAYKVRYRIELAVEEVFVNIASYAYPSGDGEVRIGIGVDGDPSTVTMVFSDDGIPFDPLAKPDADTSPDTLTSRVGGLGILMVKKLMDDVTYARVNGQNVLTLKKKVSS